MPGKKERRSKTAHKRARAAQALTAQPHWAARVAAGTLKAGAAASVPTVKKAVAKERARQQTVRAEREALTRPGLRVMPRTSGTLAGATWTTAAVTYEPPPGEPVGSPTVPADAIYRTSRRIALRRRAMWGANLIDWRWRGQLIARETRKHCRGRLGQFTLTSSLRVPPGYWQIIHKPTGRLVADWGYRPTPEEYLGAARAWWRLHGLLANHLGWRAFRWDANFGVLRSPQRRTPWHDSVMQVPNWDTSAALRGVAGIHALHAPRGWRVLPWEGDTYCGCASPAVTALVERWGRAVVGEDGWRAEWCAIRELVAPADIAGAIQAAYPDVTVHVWNKQECNQ